jgi:hypothetical protein
VHPLQVWLRGQQQGLRLGGQVLQRALLEQQGLWVQQFAPKSLKLKCSTRQQG